VTLRCTATGRLLSKSAVDHEGEGEGQGEVEDEEYLGAAMKLTSELSRYAITQVS